MLAIRIVSDAFNIHSELLCNKRDTLLCGPQVRESELCANRRFLRKQRLGQGDSSVNHRHYFVPATIELAPLVYHALDGCSGSK